MKWPEENKFHDARGEMRLEAVSNPELATPQWLSAVLKTAGVRAELVHVHASTIGTGQLGKNVRFMLEYRAPSADLPLTLVGKVPVIE